MTWPVGIPRPSQQLDDLLSGRVDWKDTPESIRSWATLYLNEAAQEILKQRDKAKRQAMLSRIPARIRPYVEKECMRL
jgi:hypothetical protein